MSKNNKKDQLVEKVNAIFEEDSQTYNDFVDSVTYEFPVSQIGFAKDGSNYRVSADDAVDSTWLVATHLSIASYTLWDSGYKKANTQSAWATRPISVSDIHDVFGFKAKNTFKNRKRVQASIELLISKGIISVEPVYTDKVDLNEHNIKYIFKQEIIVLSEDKTKGRSYFTCSVDALIKLTKLDETDTEKIKLIASYATVITGVNQVDDLDDYFSNNNIKTIKALREAFPFVSQKVMAQRIGFSENTLGKRIKKLSEMNLLFVVKAQQPQHVENQWKHFYAKYEQRFLMKSFFTAMAETSSEIDNERLVDIKHAYKEIDFKPKKVMKVTDEPIIVKFVDIYLNNKEKIQQFKEAKPEIWGSIEDEVVRRANEIQAESESYIDTTESSESEDDDLHCSDLFSQPEADMDTVTDKDDEYSFYEDENPWLGVV